MAMLTADLESNISIIIELLKPNLKQRKGIDVEKETGKK